MLLRFALRIVITAMILLSTGCGSAPVTVSEPAVRSVRYIKATVSAGVCTRAFAGTARAPIQSKLSFKVAGTIARLVVVVGERVKKGQLIAELDAKDYALQVEQAEAALRAAEAGARQAKAEYGRVQQLFENNHASKSQLDAGRTAADATAQQVTAARKQVELARRQLSFTRLEAPEEGAIALVPVEVNENIAPGYPVVLLTTRGEPEVEVAVPESVITQIKEGDSVAVAFTVVPGKIYEATVTEVGVAPTLAFQMFPIRVRLREDDNAIRPGMAADVTFHLTGEGGESHIVLPLPAVGEDRAGRYVYCLENIHDDRAKTVRRPVKTGGITNRGIAIVEGVSEGEHVVTAGVSRITNGQEVRVLPENEVKQPESAG